MGFIKNLIKYDKIEKLKAGFAIGYVRGKASQDLLKDGKLIQEDIKGVSNNMFRWVKGFNESVFLVKKNDPLNPNHDENGNFLYKDGKWEPSYDYAIINRLGDVELESLNNAVSCGDIKEDLVDFNGTDKIKQYVLDRGTTGKALLIPSRNYVSDFFKEISEPDENGLRKVTETDLETRLKGYVSSRALSYYLNEVGERISPEFVSEVDAGEYKIFWAPNNKEMLYDYIYKYDQETGSFIKQSYGYQVIDYVNGKFFAKDTSSLYFLIDENGKKISSHFMRYHVLDNGMVVGELANGLDVAEIYNNDYQKVCDLDYPTVSATRGVVVGKMKGEKDFVMFGLNTEKKYPVDGNCAKFIVKILSGSVPPKHYTASITNDLLEEEVDAMAEPTVKDLCKAISTGSLRGARGNSGVILSQLFRGFTKELADASVIDVTVLANAVSHAADTAYKAVMKPKEGTILTVARGAATRAM